MRVFTLLKLLSIFIAWCVASPAFAQVQLWVSVYHGEYPNKQGARVFSTSSVKNKLQQFRIENGQTLVVSEKTVVKIPVSTATYADNGEVVIDPNAVVPDRTPIAVATIDGELQVVDATQIDDENLKLGIPLESNQQVLKGEIAHSEQSQLIEVPVGLYITPKLIKPHYKKNQKVTLSAKVVSENNTLDNTAAKKAGIIRLNQSVETKTIIKVNEWFQLSSSQQLSHQPALNRNSRVVSTKRSDDHQQSLWVKVNIVQ